VNIGNPDEITIYEFAKEVLNIVQNPEAKIIHKPLPEDDPKVRQPDITKAREILNWEPRFNRSEGLKLTYEYFKNVVPQKTSIS
jgi:dTDP-glucose 4,6-dehydratase